MSAAWRRSGPSAPPSPCLGRERPAIHFRPPVRFPLRAVGSAPATGFGISHGAKVCRWHVFSCAFCVDVRVDRAATGAFAHVCMCVCVHVCMCVRVCVCVRTRVSVGYFDCSAAVEKAPGFPAIVPKHNGAWSSKRKEIPNNWKTFCPTHMDPVIFNECDTTDFVWRT